MERAAERIPVVRLVMPTALAGGLAGLTAGWLGAVALAPSAARVGSKEGLPVLALAFGKLTSHWPASPQANHRKIGAWKEESGEVKVGRRRAKKTEEGDKYYRWGRSRNSLTNNFNLAIESQFQVAAEIVALERGFTGLAAINSNLLRDTVTERWMVKQVTWCGENASVACSATTIERPLDATHYCNQTGSWLKYGQLEQVLFCLFSIYIDIIYSPKVSICLDNAIRVTFMFTIDLCKKFS
jgi:hypothetical protein